MPRRHRSIHATHRNEKHQVGAKLLRARIKHIEEVERQLEEMSTHMYDLISANDELLQQLRLEKQSVFELTAITGAL